MPAVVSVRALPSSAAAPRNFVQDRAPAARHAAGMDIPYVHGYAPRETQRLADQAAILRELLHDGIAFPPGSRVLEPGCGTGMQTAALLAGSPGIHVTAIDIDAAQLARAAAALASSSGVELVQADLLAAPIAPASFDHAFVCFVLEHMPQPAAALAAVRRAVAPGGSIVVMARDLLADRATQTVTLADLEALAGAGRYRLIRAFRAAYGLPPHAWQIQVRLARARTLIRSGISIAAAAVEAGSRTRPT